MPGWLAETSIVEKWLALAEHAKEEGVLNCTTLKIPAAEFAAAAQSLISVFDLISGMGMAKGDMVGNATTVEKAAKAYAANPRPIWGCLRDPVALQDLIGEETEGLGEKALKSLSQDGKTITCALLWLARGLPLVKLEHM